MDGMVRQLPPLRRPALRHPERSRGPLVLPQPCLQFTFPVVAHGPVPCDRAKPDNQPCPPTNPKFGNAFPPSCHSERSENSRLVPTRLLRCVYHIAMACTTTKGLAAAPFIELRSP